MLSYGYKKTQLAAELAQHDHQQKQSYAEKKHIAELERERQIPFEDLVSLPWVGEFYDQLDG